MIDYADSHKPAPAVEPPAGLVCPGCRGAAWKVRRTVSGRGVIRRWRVCLKCGAEIRTREALEAGDNPDQDAAGTG